MKIRKIETLIASTAWQYYRLNYVFVKVYTDEGLEGLGQAYSAGPELATAKVVEDFESWLVGRDPFQIEFLWQLMYQGSRFPPGVVVAGAISGIEQALWDIKGKALGVPIYELLGGKCRDRVRVYQGVYDETPEEMADSTEALIKRYGYTAIKISPQPLTYGSMSESQILSASEARMRAAREAGGPDLDIGVDSHARIFEPIRALEMMEVLRPYRPFFLEEPLRPENMDALALLRAKARVPIASGEILYTKYQFRNLMAREAVDIIQPDVCATGGLMEMKKIAALAEASYVSVAPHNPMGPVAAAVNVHFAASTPNFLVLEYKADDQPPLREIVKEPLILKDGYLELPTAPGLGVELNEEWVRAHPYRPWHRPFPFRPDGSMGLI